MHQHPSVAVYYIIDAEAKGSTVFRIPMAPGCDARA